MAESKGTQLSKQVRSSRDGGDFDLAGFEAHQLQDLASGAFTTPISSSVGYLKFTFTVGAGKKMRQKYNDATPKEFSQALSGLGFSEDRGASACEQCQGFYK